MKASQLKAWPSNIQPHEWPKGTLDHMDADLFTDCVFPLRKKSGIPMTPSPLFAAHVRNDESGSQQSIYGARPGKQNSPWQQGCYLNKTSV